MFYPGLVSISFRKHTVEEIAEAVAQAGLPYVEWGSDVHAPCTDDAALEAVAALQKKYGITCCSYGTYFRLGVTPPEELPAYLRAAEKLGTKILRLWAGEKKAADCTPQERERLFDEGRKAAALAAQHGMTLCMECHRRSYTETKEGALELMEAVNSPHFGIYWQPNPDVSQQENMAYLRLLQPYITHIHVFHWLDVRKLPLAEGAEPWAEYLAALQGDHHLLLEFMPDDRLATLPVEAGVLKGWIDRMAAHC